jgi:hypothetical protein
VSKRNLKRQPDEVLINRIFEKITIDDNGCWLWDNDKQRGGYGMFWDGQKPKSAHRLVYELLVSKVESKDCVCHKCDNRRCVDPSHMFIGSHADNSADMVSKGRQAKGNRHWTKTSPELLDGHAVGEKNSRAKLKDKDVKLIRESSLSVKELAEIYGMSYMGMYKVKSGLRWAHVK